MAEFYTRDFQTYSFTSQEGVFQNTTEAGFIHSRVLEGSQRYSFTIATVPKDISESKTLAGFIRQHGTYAPFTVVPACLASSSGWLTGQQLTTSGSGSVGGNTISVGSSVGTQATALKAGDFIKFSLTDKVYELVYDLNLSGGSGTVTVFPPFQDSISSGQTVTYMNVPFTVVNQAINDFTQTATGEGRFPRVELDVVEYK